MNVEYGDGRREVLTGLSPDQVAEHAKRVTTDPEFEKAEIIQQSGPGLHEPNRHERRKWAAQQRKQGKR